MVRLCLYSPCFNFYLRSLAIEKLNIDRFLELGKTFPVLDVRSPGEYDHAHIPGAFNLPLFTDEERKIVGTAYKQQSREVAIKIGLEYFGTKMRKMVEDVESILHSKYPGSGSPQVLVHCWRGGMRSAGVAWLLDLYGYKVHTLSGGYKSYRHWIVDSFSMPFTYNILAGFTGSGKTYLLAEMKSKGAAVIDLEKLANHKGSAFGNIGMPGQPTQEMFENLLGHELRNLADTQECMPGPVWLEDESQRIGQINIPPALWNNMSFSPIVFMAIPFEERLKHIVHEYGELDKEKMADAILRIQKKLGGLETKAALQYLDEHGIESCFRILLKYYDKLYNKALKNRDPSKQMLTYLDCGTVDPVQNAERVMNKEFSIK
jgi:tRNA 2-selenouridine synthase